METSSFFNSIDHDRLYKAEDWAAYFASFIGNGVFARPSNNLQVMAGGGMNITVRPGKAWINGYFYTNTEDLNMSLSAAHGLLNRIDRVVVRWDLAARDITVKVKSSEYTSSPVAPALERNADVWEICLADIHINNGVASVSQANIVDQRLDNSLCGFVAGVVQQIDTEAFNAQLQAWFRDYQKYVDEEYKEYVTHVDNEFNNFVTYVENLEGNSDQTYESFQRHLTAFEQEAEQEFDEWFESVRDTLGEDTAGQLFNAIDSMARRMIEIRREIPSTVIGKFTVNPAEWQDNIVNDEDAAYIYHADIINDRITDAHHGTITYHPMSKRAVAMAKVSSTNDTITGAIRLWAKKIPADILTGEYGVFAEPQPPEKTTINPIAGVAVAGRSVFWQHGFRGY